MFQTVVIFQKNLGQHGEKSKKLLQIRNFHIINDFEQFFTFFNIKVIIKTAGLKK